MDNKIFNTRTVKNQYISLLERRREIEPQYIKLRDEIDALNIQISGLDQALRAAGVDTEKIRNKIHPAKPQIETIRKEDTLPELIHKMLTAYNKPMHYTEIWKQLESSGVRIGGKDRANTVLAYISRNKSKFMKASEAGRGFYKIRE